MKRLLLSLLVGVFLLAGFAPAPLQAAQPERTNLYVQVKDTETGQPVYQAHITLQFRFNPGKLKRARTVSFSAKTNAQGRYKFTDIPKGAIRLIVTADRRQTYGQDLELTQDDQVFEVKLRKPQPLL